MTRASILLPAILGAALSAAEGEPEKIVSLVSRSDGTRAAFAVVVTDRSGARLTTDEPLVVDLMVGDAVVGTLTVEQGSAVSPALHLASDLADSGKLLGRMRIVGTTIHAGDLHPTPAKPVSVN